MSQYLKPQAPLYNEGHDKYIYPLTTASQVIDETTGHRMSVEGVFKRDILTLEEMSAVTGSLDDYAVSASSFKEYTSSERILFTPTLNISGTYADNTCYKIGHLVFFYVYASGLTTATARTPIFTFQYKPKYSTYFIGAGAFNNIENWASFIYCIDVNGNLTQSHTSSSLYIAAISGCYYTDD